MDEILVKCDRCKKLIQSFIQWDEKKKNIITTCNFYDVSKGYWHKFANTGELILCDECLEKDTEYRRISKLNRRYL